MVRRAKRGSDQTYFQPGGVLLRFTVTDPSILVSHCLPAVLHAHVPSTDHLGLTSRVPPQEVVAMRGIYVDDFLIAGPSPVVRLFLATSRKMWKTSDPQYLTIDAELPFLGVSSRMTKDDLV